MSPLAALQTATVNPAEFFNISDDLGSIETGKFADIVVLDENPLIDISNTLSIAGVVSRGAFINREALDGMLETLNGQ